MGLIAAAIARGFQAPPPQSGAASFLAGDSFVDRAGAVEMLAGHLRAGVAIFCPTYVERSSLDEQTRLAKDLLAQARFVGDRLPRLTLVLMIGLQHGDDTGDEARQRVLQMRSVALQEGVCTFVGFVLPGTGKVRSLNAAIGLARECEIDALVLVDDDIRLEEGCFERLIQRFLAKGRRGAVGATKLAITGEHWSARWLAKIGRYGQPRRASPHACCMIVSLEVIGSGIPARYVDDAYVFFELLEPGDPDPLRWLEVMPDARCWHIVVGDSLGATSTRLRRVLITHHVMLADYPTKARFYRRQMLFLGLWPFGAPAAGDEPRRAASRWLAKSLYGLLFIAVGCELFLRGILGRPLFDFGWPSSTLQRPHAGIYPEKPFK